MEYRHRQNTQGKEFTALMMTKNNNSVIDLDKARKRLRPLPSPSPSPMTPVRFERTVLFQLWLDTDGKIFATTDKGKLKELMKMEGLAVSAESAILQALKQSISLLANLEIELYEDMWTRE